MLILSLESSAKPASVAICSGNELLGQYFQNSGLTHSRTLLLMAESLLKNLGLELSGIGLVAVSRGPGSFTGVRIGVSAAKGLAWGKDIPVCGVSTIEAMAYQTPVSGAVICPVMDARRGQVYNALFERRDGELVRLCEDRAVSLDDLADELRGILDAPTANSCVYLVGDGAALSNEHLTNAGINCQLAPELLRWQTAYGVALAAQNADHIPAIELEPGYLRPSQAERERNKEAI